MSWIFYGSLALLLVVAALALWRAVMSPDWIAGVLIAGGRVILGLLGGLLAAQVKKDMADPEVDRRNKEAAHHPGGEIHPGTGVTTGKTITQPAAAPRNRPKP